MPFVELEWEGVGDRRVGASIHVLLLVAVTRLLMGTFLFERKHFRRIGLWLCNLVANCLREKKFDVTCATFL